MSSQPVTDLFTLQFWRDIAQGKDPAGENTMPVIDDSKAIDLLNLPLNDNWANRGIRETVLYWTDRVQASGRPHRGKPGSLGSTYFYQSNKPEYEAHQVVTFAMTLNQELQNFDGNAYMNMGITAKEGQVGYAPYTGFRGLESAMTKSGLKAERLAGAWQEQFDGNFAAYTHTNKYSGVLEEDVMAVRQPVASRGLQKLTA